MATLTLSTDPRNAVEALRLAKTTEKARGLRKEGYRFEDLGIDSIAVIKPGRIAASYTVNAHTGECDCPDWQEHKNFCKHSIACQEVLDNERMWEERSE